MKKQQMKSLTLNKSSISNLQLQEVKGGRTGGACVNTYTCPQTVVHTCQLTDVRTCTLSVIQCTN